MSFPAYDEYNDSGVEWLGDVPDYWEVRRLKFLSNIQTGDKDTVNADEDAEYPFFVRSQTVERISTCTFDCEAILTAGDGVGVGKVFHYHDGPFDFHQRVYMMNNFREVDGRFLFHYLKSNFYKVALEGGAKSTVDSIRRPMIADFPVSFPPEEDEQMAISSFLDVETSKIDGLVSEQRRLTRLLAEKRQAVISQAVTKGLCPGAPMKPSGIQWLGDVPKHWTRSQPKYFTTKIVDGVHFKPTYVDEGVPFITVQNLTAGRGISFENLNYITKEDHEEYFKRANPEKGDVLITKDGTLGVVRVIETDRVFSIFVSVALLKPIKEIIDPWFMAYALESDVVFQQFQARQLGSALKHIHLVELRNVFVMLPPLDEQREIVHALRREVGRLETMLAEAERAIELLQERRTALISAAVTGKIDVREFASCERQGASRRSVSATKQGESK